MNNYNIYIIFINIGVLFMHDWNGFISAAVEIPEKELFQLILFILF